MAIELVVTEPFGTPDGKMYQHGDQITDPAEVAAYQKAFPKHVVRRSVPDAPVDETVANDAAASTPKRNAKSPQPLE